MELIITEEEIRDQLHDHYQTGGGNIFYCGFNRLARHYNVKEGGVTDWTGLPGSGKTELLLEILHNCSKWYGHKHLINMPDAGSPVEVVAKLIHKMSGKQFKKHYYTEIGEKKDVVNRISEEEMFRLLPEVLKSFKIYDPRKGSKKGRSKANTPREFWDYAAKVKNEAGLFSAVIDSWNYMKHDSSGFDREDKWLEDILSYRNELAETSGLHFHTIIHPKTQKEDKNGKVLMPTMHSLKGGSEWPNNGKTIIIVHRKAGSPMSEIKIDKAKPEIVGVMGMVCLKYDAKSAKWYENLKETGLKRFYAHEHPIISAEDKAEKGEEDNEHFDDGPTHDEVFSDPDIADPITNNSDEEELF